MNKAAKVILCGPTTVGKTTLMRALCNLNTHDPVSPTMAAGFSSLSVSNGGEEVLINLWDTAGQEAYRSLIRIYFRDVDVAIILFDLTNRQSFDELEYWVNEVRQNSNVDEFQMILVGNKVDLEREISADEFRDKANTLQALYAEVSALENMGIPNLRDLIAKAYLEKPFSSTIRKDKEVVDIVEDSTPMKPCAPVGKKRYTPIIDNQPIEKEEEEKTHKKCC